MKVQTPVSQFTLWQSEPLFNIDFAGYALSHHHFERHFHNHYVIELVLKGADHFYCDGKNYTAGTDQMVLINPGEVHTGSTVANEPLHYFSLYPDKKALQQVAESAGITLPADFRFPLTLQNESSLTAKFRLLFDSFIAGTDSLYQQELFIDCMHGLLGQQACKTTAEENKKDNRVNLLTAFISTHFKEDISLQQMADLVCLNPFHLVRLFKRIIGVSPYDYLLITRTEFAKQLLRKGYQVQQAALEAGFYDTSHLNRSVRKIAGTSPKSFLSSKGQYRTIFSR